MFCMFYCIVLHTEWIMGAPRAENYFGQVFVLNRDIRRNSNERYLEGILSSFTLTGTRVSLLQTPFEMT